MNSEFEFYDLDGILVRKTCQADPVYHGFYGTRWMIFKDVHRVIFRANQITEELAAKMYQDLHYIRQGTAISDSEVFAELKN